MGLAMLHTYWCAGWRGNGQQCQDIDECLEGTSGCDHTCINKPGTYQCACAEGYNLVSQSGAALGNNRMPHHIMQH